MTETTMPLCPKFVAAGEGMPLHAPGGDLHIPKLGCAASGNTFQMIEYVANPGGGPPLHVHDREDEAFYVLEGEINFWVSDAGDRTGKTGRRVVAPTGSFAFAPRGSAHTFKNCSKEKARMLICVNPGANFEAFFDKVGALDAQGKPPPDQEIIRRIGTLAGEYGITILGPSPL